MAEELTPHSGVTRTMSELVEAFSLAMHPGRLCPGCECCTRALCEAGSQSPSGCVGLTSAADPELRGRIAACACTRTPAPPALDQPEAACSWPCDADCDADCHQEHMPSWKRDPAECARCRGRTLDQPAHEHTEGDPR